MEFIEVGNDLVFTDKTELRKIEITIINGAIGEHISGKKRICDEDGCEITNFYIPNDLELAKKRCKEVYEQEVKYFDRKPLKHEYIDAESFEVYLNGLLQLVKDNKDIIINCAYKLNGQLFKSIPCKYIRTRLTQDHSLWITFNSGNYKFLLEIYYIVEEGESECVVSGYKNDEIMLLQHGSLEFVIDQIKTLYEPNR